MGAIVTVTIARSQRGRGADMRFCPCGNVIPRRKERGHREREYCSNKCRQHACRVRNKEKHDLARIEREMNERLYNAAYQDIHRETWQDELEQMEQERDRANRLLLDYLEETRLLRESVDFLQNMLADKEAEIVRLTTLLESQATRKRRRLSLT